MDGDRAVLQITDLFPRSQPGPNRVHEPHTFGPCDVRGHFPPNREQQRSNSPAQPPFYTTEQKQGASGAICIHPQVCPTRAKPVSVVVYTADTPEISTVLLAGPSSGPCMKYRCCGQGRQIFYI